MELENLVKLIQAVSDSALSGFEYEEGNVSVEQEEEEYEIPEPEEPKFNS